MSTVAGFKGLQKLKKKYKTAPSNRLAGRFKNKNKNGKMRILNINGNIPKRTRTVVKSAVKLGAPFYITIFYKLKYQRFLK